VKNSRFLCSSLTNVSYQYQYCKVERWLSEAGWAAVKAILKEISTDSQSNHSYPIGALCLGEPLQFPNELKCESIHAIILESSRWASSTLLNISFLENVPNLKMLGLFSIVINENIVPVLSKLY
jgi:hypothetical protein